ncbi:MAG: hypothetical protein E7Z63_01095 [Thermoplasmata archaeon]|nr:hypothetical protein [Thermoplasmata archaeon]
MADADLSNPGLNKVWGVLGTEKFVEELIRACDTDELQDCIIWIAKMWDIRLPDGDEADGQQRSFSAKPRTVVDHGSIPARYCRTRLTPKGYVSDEYWDRKKSRTPGFEEDRKTSAKHVYKNRLTPEIADEYVRRNQRNPSLYDRVGYDCPLGTRANIRVKTEAQVKEERLRNLEKARKAKAMKAKKTSANATKSPSKAKTSSKPKSTPTKTKKTSQKAKSAPSKTAKTKGAR